MRHSYLRRSHAGEIFRAPPVSDFPAALERTLLAQSTPTDFVDELYAAETMTTSGRSFHDDEGPEPFSLQWYLEIESRRLTRHGSWLPRLLEFAKHSSERLLGIGHGLGTDWVQYARYGASVVTCSPSPSRLALVRRNFELRGLSGSFLQALPESLPLENASMDVVCISSWLDGSVEPASMVNEIYRVLKPGGKVLALAPAKYDVAFWSRLFAPWRRWLGTTQPGRFAGQPLSARRLRKLFAPFIEHRIHKRQLRRRETPLLWRGIPLYALQRMMGHILVLKAFKPLSAAISVPLAA